MAESTRKDPDKIRATISITNVVVTVVLGCNINLRLLSLLQNTQGRYNQFPALDMRFKGEKKSSTALIFRTGTATLPGSSSVEDATKRTHVMRLVLEDFLTDHYRGVGWPQCGRKTRDGGRIFDFYNYRVVNIVFTMLLDHGISLESFVEAARGRAVYEPDLFSSAKFGLPDTFYGCKVNVFEGGRITLMGGKTVEQTMLAADETMKYIAHNTRDDVQANPNARYSSRMARFRESDIVSATRTPLPISPRPLIEIKREDEIETGASIDSPIPVRVNGTTQSSVEQDGDGANVISTLADEYGMSVKQFKQTYDVKEL